MGACALVPVLAAAEDITGPAPPAPELAALRRDKEFIQNWLLDLLDTMDAELDEATRIRLMEGCGRGCFRRHEFKRAIAREGQGDLEKLIAAYDRNFEIWRDEAGVHIRYGAVSKGCYCPAARFKPAKPHDLHCECTRATHQAIFETALARPVRIEILQSVRRGDPTCHFLVHV